MDKKEFFKQRIDKIAKESFNNNQKEIAKKIIDQTNDNDLDAVWGLISQRVKTGFVFDEAPEINHNCVAYIKENEKLGVNLENKEALEHALIIGENYDALKNLVSMYTDKQGKGLIDVIYIDPPYNTDKSKKEGNDYKEKIEGKNKFIYRDKYTRDGWLNLMNERLKLAKKILSDTGVIFISIDDKEQAYLKILCDEIFGEENFIANCARRKNKLVMKGDKQFKSVIEYLLVYGKIKKDIKFLYKQSDTTQSDFSVISAGYGRKTITFAPGTISFRDKEGVVLKGEYKNLSLLDDLTIKDNVNENEVKINAEFKWEEKTLIDKLNKNAYILVKKKENMGMRIYFLNDSARPLDYIDEKYGKVTNEDGENDYKILGIKEDFDYPKPVDFIKFLCSLNCKQDSIILDFFAGSGTTGQAVMELNEEDGGNRKFILVTNNENNIAKNVTRERIYRVIKGKGSKGEEFEWTYSKDKKNLANNSLRVFDIVKQELNITETDRAEKIKEEVESNFTKLKADYLKNSNFNIYNVLSSLTPYKNESED